MRFLHWLSWVGYQLDIGAFSNNYQGNLREPSEKVLGFATTESSYGAQLRNYAALIPSEKTQLEVTQVPFPSCGDDELVIRNHVVAVNPIDWKESMFQILKQLFKFSREETTHDSFFLARVSGSQGIKHN